MDIAADVNLEVLFEDSALRVINKPTGLSVLCDNTGAISLTDCYTRSFNEQPLFVHRLDKGTSGVLLVARAPSTRSKLQRSFQNNQVKKRYLALVSGVPAEPAEDINAPLEPARKGRYRVAVKSPGKSAHTSYRQLASRGDRSLLVCSPSTGRTHQIRVHLAYLGTPLWVDPLYGHQKNKPSLHPELTLHAWQVEFPHPEQTVSLKITAPLPNWALDWEEMCGEELKTFKQVEFIPRLDQYQESGPV